MMEGKIDGGHRLRSDSINHSRRSLGDGGGKHKWVDRARAEAPTSHSAKGTRLDLL